MYVCYRPNHPCSSGYSRNPLTHSGLKNQFLQFALLVEYLREIVITDFGVLRSHLVNSPGFGSVLQS